MEEQFTLTLSKEQAARLLTMLNSDSHSVEESEYYEKCEMCQVAKELDRLLRPSVRGERAS